MARPSKEVQLTLLVADVYEAAGALRRMGDAIASEVGQSQARWQVLSVLSDRGGTASGAARRLGVSRQAVQRIVDRLLDEGLLRAAIDPGDRRAPLLTLTAPGRRALHVIEAQARAWHEETARGLTAAELETTRRTLQAVVAACRQTDDEDDPG